jgi:hypothetical protein
MPAQRLPRKPDRPALRANEKAHRKVGFLLRERLITS